MSHQLYVYITGHAKQAALTAPAEGGLCGRKRSGPEQKGMEYKRQHPWPGTKIDQQTCNCVTGKTAGNANCIEGQNPESPGHSSG